MASGHLILRLSERVKWEEFPEFVTAVLVRLDGQLLDANDAVVMRIWTARIDGRVIRIVWDDHPGIVSLEAEDEQGDRVLERAFDSLSLKGDG